MQELQGSQEQACKITDTPLWQYAVLAETSYRGDAAAGDFQRICLGSGEAIFAKVDGQEMWLGFGGSTGQPQHWLGSKGNLSLTMSPWPCGFGVSGMIHSGYAAALAQLAEALQNFCAPHVDAIKVLRLAGHSRGGALATLLGMHLAKEFQNLGVQVRVVAFGCPRVGDSHFTKEYRAQDNLCWVGVLHGQDVVGQLPLWCCHVHPPLEPGTIFRSRALPVKWSRVLSMLGAVIQSHCMRGYKFSLKCDFALRGANQDAQDLMAEIRDPRLKAALAITVHTTHECTSALMQQMQRISQQMQELLSPESLGEIMRQQLYKMKVEELSGMLHWLADNLAKDDCEALRATLTDIEQRLYQLAVHAAGQLSNEARAKLLEFILQAAMALPLGFARLEMGTAQILEKMQDYATRLRKPLSLLAEEVQDRAKFFEALPSLLELEMTYAVYAGAREPVLLDDDLQVSLVPLELQPSERRRLKMQQFLNDCSRQLAEGTLPAVHLLRRRLGPLLVNILADIVGQVDWKDTDEEEGALREVSRLQERVDSLGLPQVAVTGPSNSGKSSLVNTLVGRDVTSTLATPDSLLPVRLLPDAEGAACAQLVQWSLLSVSVMRNRPWVSPRAVRPRHPRVRVEAQP